MTLKSVDSEPSGKGWGLVIPFKDSSASFCNGFEAGGIFQQLKTTSYCLGSEESPLTVQTSNLELYKDIAEYFRCYMGEKDTEVEGWTYVWFTKKKTTLTAI
jgi:hypothetical protein